MIAINRNAQAGCEADEIFSRLANLEEGRWESLKSRDPAPKATYLAGESDRMNPMPKGIDPYGTDADYHYRTDRNYFLMVERGRAAVRNHPLVEQGINRLIANLKLGEFTLDVDSGDDQVDKDLKAQWDGWTGDKNECDYERSRSFQQIVRQSFFNQVQDGDILHLPLIDGRLQTWEAHHVRTPWGHRPTGLATDGIIHGAEVRNGQIVAYHITPQSLSSGQTVRRGQTTRFPTVDADGKSIAFWMGFRHRFYQRRGISRMSAPRDAMNGFADLNYANIKSSLRRALISYLMKSTTPPLPGANFGAPGKIPQAGDRYAQNIGLGVQAVTIEQMGEAAQVMRPPEGYTLEGWNANIPGPQFFEHSALLLTMLSVNLELPLMFLLLDGSLVNFHGGRMTFDQAKLRFRQIQQDVIEGLYKPTYEWQIRLRITPGSPKFDPALAAAVARGFNPFKYQFRPAAWPYVKPMEDAQAEKLAETSNLRSMRSILSDRGVDFDEHVPEVIRDRGKWARAAIKEATAIRNEFPDAEIHVPQFFRELMYGARSPLVEAQVVKAEEIVAQETVDEGGEPPTKSKLQRGDDA